MTDKTIFKDLINAQKEFGPALKTSTNPHFRSKYADLSACVEAVIDALNNNNFYLMQKTHECESGVAVETILQHISGESISSGIIKVPAQKQDAQGHGSALTYARRYSLMTVCGIAPEDDDGHAASNNTKQNYGQYSTQSKMESIKEKAKIDQSLVEVAKMYANKGTEELKKWFSDLEEHKKVSLTAIKADLWIKAKSVDENKSIVQ